ncbi:hypothetical protein [Stenotrophomonas sp. GD03657]|uniref:hypothetical protein n=1 Tax=Stenotrophomonas sp. GD03657 TaxID=2975363 RepID=UPI00244984D9|nr:hypothetical protein [Stenotrophomonas sp. GD03657]MDH2154089.1 hypothetical protein [Stenotrophomonas sp. GD03657]
MRSFAEIKSSIDAHEARLAAMTPKERAEYDRCCALIRSIDPITMLRRPDPPSDPGLFREIADKLRKHNVMFILPRAPERD